MTTTTCPACSREWPSDRFAWAIPGVFHSDKHILGSRCVTFCARRCQRPLYCPPVFDLELYDLGLYPSVSIFPGCKIIDLGVKWFWMIETGVRPELGWWRYLLKVPKDPFRILGKKDPL